MTRSTIIAALLLVELAIIGEAAVALRGGQSAPWAALGAGSDVASGTRLLEGGPHQIYDVGEHPALSVDIGNADLTILTGNASKIDVSVSPSSDFGIFRATAPIAARADGTTIRIATNHGRGWSVGDDRMVTIVVPANTQVTVVDAGDIKANGLRAEASITSVGQGSVTLDDYDAPALTIESNGRISMHQVAAARLDVTSHNDGVDGTALHVRDGSIESDDRVMLGFASGSDTLVTAEASDGRINVSGYNADASTTNEQTVRIGSGNGHLDVHSSDGNITLAREN
jgi:hypothetical protein